MKRAVSLISIFLFLAIPLFGHTYTKEEIVAYLNSKEIRQEAGIEKASLDPKLERLLIIEVNEGWYKLEPSARVNYAKKWFSMWRHSVSRGIVSILDKESGETVVNYHPDGRIELTK